MTVVRDHTKDLAKALQKLASERVLVGIPATAADREPDPDDPEPINNAVLGRILEQGAPAANIPARPHLVPGVEGQKDKIAARYKGAAKLVLNGKLEAIRSVHAIVGQETADAVKLKIETGPFIALAESTLADRRRRGIASEKPLVRTGEYRDAITYVIRPTGK